MKLSINPNQHYWQYPEIFETDPQHRIVPISFKRNPIEVCLLGYQESIGWSEVCYIL